VDDQVRVMNRWRRYGAFFGLVWLFVLIPDAVTEVTGPHRPALKIAVLAAVAVFAGLYTLYWLSVARTGEPAAPLAILLGLCGLAAGITLVSFGSWSGLFIYCAVAAGFGFPWRAGIAATVGVAGLAAVVGLASRADPVWFAILPPICLLMGIAMVWINQMVMSYHALRLAREESARLAVAEERLRFARDLHDLLGHSLSLIVLKSELAGRLMEASPQRAAVEVRDIERVAREALREVRDAVSGYREPALRQEVEGARQALMDAGIEVELTQPASPLPPPVETVLAWAVREGATNVLRHSHAQRVSVSLESRAGVASLEIVDDGVGCQAETGGTGLRGLRERVEACGGRVEFGTSRDGGYRLAVSIPLDPAAAEASS
jgi:two-component system sensor histidine kinase DesK